MYEQNHTSRTLKDFTLVVLWHEQRPETGLRSERPRSFEGEALQKVGEDQEEFTAGKYLSRTLTLSDPKLQHSVQQFLKKTLRMLKNARRSNV